ncbi:MAG: hypothetical protein WC340_00500 [Kiritimatiellia bacterium]
MKEMILIWTLFAALFSAAADGVVVKQAVSLGVNAQLDPLTAESAKPYEAGFERVDNVYLCDNGGTDKVKRGVMWSITLNQSEALPIAASAWARAEGVFGAANTEFSLYIDLVYMDGTYLWGQSAAFDPDPAVGWHQRQVVVKPDKPIRSVSLYLLFRNRAGKVMFKEAQFGTLRNKMLYFDGVAVEQVIPPQCGFLLRDVAAGSGFVVLEKEALGVRLTTRQRTAPGVTFYDVTLADLTGKDRALTLVFTRPLQGEALTWFHHPRRTVALGDKMNEVMNATRQMAGSIGLLSRYPFGAVSVGGQGRAIGLDPATPLFFRIGCQPNSRELFLACDIGLALEKPQASFSIVLFDFEAVDGFRGALARYYAIYPAAFETRVKKQGIWMPFASISKVEGWEDFGFRFKEGDNETAWDDAHDILTFRYTEPMTWWMALDGSSPRILNRAEEEARRLAATGNRAALAWQSSAFEDEQGGISGLVRDTPWCNGVVWSMNSAPGVAGEVTDFKQKWNSKYIDKQYGPSRTAELDGEYVDSAEAYVTAVMDFRRDHFAGMERPLCYALQSWKIGVFKGMIGFEYVRAMQQEIHRRGRYMMANATPISWFWLAPLLDVLGTESNWNRAGQWSPMSDEELLYRRAMCRGKPFCFLMNTDFSKFSYEHSEKFMQRTLAYGMFPGYFSGDASTGHYFSRPELYNRDRPLFKKYVPLCRLVAEAGWEPLTRAVSDNEAVTVERFGESPGLIYLTVYNGSQKPQSATVTLDARLPAAGGCRELVEGGELAFQGRRELFNLPPDAVRVLKFRPITGGKADFQ